MQWTLDHDNNSNLGTIVFEPADVFRLSQLGADLPWLSGLDPYRDRRVGADELPFARQDLEFALARHCVDYDRTHREPGGVAARGSQPATAHRSARALASDRTYRLLLDAIALLRYAEALGLTIQVYGQ